MTRAAPDLSRPKMPAPFEAQITMKTASYSRLLGIADLAPLYALPIDQNHLQRASTLGYTRIGHVRLSQQDKLSQDLGEEATTAILAALAAFGLTELEAQEQS